MSQRLGVMIALPALALLLLVGLRWDADQTLESCRLVNMGLGLAVAAGFFLRVNDAWAQYGFGGRLVRLGLLLLLVVVAAGSAEAYLTAAELGYRVLGITVSLIVTAAGLVLIPDDPV